MKQYGNFNGFDWDDGNRYKNEKKHNVKWTECEEIFFNQPLIILDDPKHSVNEIRFAVYGKTNEERFLSIIYTKRDDLIRVISSRDMNQKEKKFYENYEEKNS